MRKQESHLRGKKGKYEHRKSGRYGEHFTDAKQSMNMLISI